MHVYTHACTHVYTHTHVYAPVYKNARCLFCLRMPIVLAFADRLACGREPQRGMAQILAESHGGVWHGSWQRATTGIRARLGKNTRVRVVREGDDMRSQMREGGLVTGR